MLTESVLVGVLILLLGGKGRSFAFQVKIKGVYLPMAAFALELLAQFVIDGGFGALGFQLWLRELLLTRPLAVEVLVYCLLLTFCWMNRQQPGFKVLAFGTLLNALVIGANSGFMPVDAAGVERLGYPAVAERLRQTTVFAHRAADSGTLLFELCDWIHLTPPYPMPKSTSLGDWVMGVGVIWFFIRWKPDLSASDEARHGGESEVLGVEE